MKLLFDQNISYRILNRLPELFTNSQQVRTVGLENETDLNIWEYARIYGYVIVTFDADFYDISLLKGCPPKIIWLRTGNLTTVEIAAQIILHSQQILAFGEMPDLSCLEIY
jgi:predicted nuclease of predicted toxin-antitoxin system